MDGFFAGDNRVLDEVAEAALGLWPVPKDARPTLINVSENRTYLIASPHRPCAVLRMHQPSYRTKVEIEGELAWTQDLRAQHLISTPAAIPGLNGEAVQEVEVRGSAQPLFLVLFEHLPGNHPSAGSDLISHFEQLGSMAARLHNHAQSWKPTAGIPRPHLTPEALLGRKADWGDWRAAPGVEEGCFAILEDAETALCERLETYGIGADRYGLIHADMRLANLLADGPKLHLIDFDDCAIGWFLYDFAASISFMETDPIVPTLKAVWLKAYRELRPFDTEQDQTMIDALVLVRRMALLGWIGSHPHADEARKLAPHFASGTAQLARAFFSQLQEG